MTATVTIVAQPARSYSDRLYTLKREMDHSPGRLYTIKNVATDLCMSASSLSSGFKQLFGISFHRYLLSLRMLQAARLLAETYEPIRQVGASCGFATASGFNKAFKKRYGLSPVAFRSLYTKWDYENFNKRS